MNELISIIIPVYNAEKYLQRCIDSILSQTYKNVEIILIDDCSKDASLVICETAALGDSRVVVINLSQNKGQAAARNAGLEIAKGEYIVFVDSDDFINSCFLERMLELLNEYKADIVQCSAESGTNDYFASAEQKSITIREYCDSNMFLDPSRTVKITVWGKLYKKYLFDDIRFKEGKRIDDEFFTYKVLAKANRVVCTNERLYYYYKNPSSVMHNAEISNNMDFIEAYRERIEFFATNNDEVGVLASKKEYAIRLALKGLQAIRCQDSNRIAAQCATEFMQLYDCIKNIDTLSIKEKGLFFLFRTVIIFAKLK